MELRREPNSRAWKGWIWKGWIWEVSQIEEVVKERVVEGELGGEVERGFWKHGSTH